MRCQFCGWDNPEDKDCCEKCNKPLKVVNQYVDSTLSEANQSNNTRPTDRYNNEIFDPKKTVREDAISESDHHDSVKSCPQCGYALENGECASCGYTEGNISVSKSYIDSELRRTQRPLRKTDNNHSFTLTPISEDNGMPEGEPIHFDGISVALNRGNTDPNNMTITSFEQAHISCENDTWTIEDKSEYKTTFVQASRGIEIVSGDLILLGTQLYRFDC